MRIFGSNGTGVITCIEIFTLFAAQTEPAFAKAQVQRFIKCAAFFHDGILAYHTHVADTLLHIGDDIGCLGQHQFNVGIRQTENQLTGTGAQLADIITGMLQKRQCFLFQSALGQSDTNGIFRCHARTSISFTAPSRKMTSVR